MTAFLSGNLSIMKEAEVKADLQNQGVPASNITVQYEATTDKDDDGYVIRSNVDPGVQFDAETTQIVLTVMQYTALSSTESSSSSTVQPPSSSSSSSSSDATTTP
jgi:serine/threonine-protein kinase